MISYWIRLSLSNLLCIIVPRFIHIAENVIVSFFSMGEEYFLVHIHHIFPRSSVDEPLGCFHVLAIVNSASVNIGMRVVLSSFLDICPRVGLLDLMVTTELEIF